jgi:hypothetical protein
VLDQVSHPEPPFKKLISLSMPQKQGNLIMTQTVPVTSTQDTNSSTLHLGLTNQDLAELEESGDLINSQPGEWQLHNNQNQNQNNTEEGVSTMPATSPDMVGKAKSAKRSSPRKQINPEFQPGTYVCSTFGCGEVIEVQSGSHKVRWDDGAECWLAAGSNLGEFPEDLKQFKEHVKQGCPEGNRVIVGKLYCTITEFRYCTNEHRVLPIVKPDGDYGERFALPEQIKPIPEGQLDIFLGGEPVEAALLPPDPDEESEAFAVYNFLSLAKEPVIDIVIAIETGLSVPVTKQALQKLHADGLVESVDEKEGTWKALAIASCLEASEASVSQHSESGESQQPNTSISTSMPKLSIVPTSPTSQSGQTSAVTTPNGESSTLSPVVSPAQAKVTRENGKAPLPPPLSSGEKGAESLSKPDQDSSLLSNLQAFSDEDFEQFLGDCEWQGIVSSLPQFEQGTWEQDTNENESLSFPTLTSGDKPSPNVRPPGSTKCEQWFKRQGLIPNGSQLGTNAIASIRGR